jgi:hypothetical protein
MYATPLVSYMERSDIVKDPSYYLKCTRLTSSHGLFCNVLVRTLIFLLVLCQIHLFQTWFSQKVGIPYHSPKNTVKDYLQVHYKKRPSISKKKTIYNTDITEHGGGSNPLIPPVERVTPLHPLPTTKVSPKNAISNFFPHMVLPCSRSLPRPVPASLLPWATPIAGEPITDAVPSPYATHPLHARRCRSSVGPYRHRRTPPRR